MKLAPWYNNIEWNIPNILSMYRLAMAPVLLLLIYLGFEKIFVALFIVSLLTDIADGFIARRFNMQTSSGAVLDSLADIGSYVVAVSGIVKFHYYLFTNHGYWLLAFVIFYILTLIVPQLHYGRPSAGLHLYSSKIGGYAQGIFLVVLFAHGMVLPLFYIAMCIGYYSEVEGIIINSLSKQPQLNCKTIFHWWQGRKQP